MKWRGLLCTHPRGRQPSHQGRPQAFPGMVTKGFYHQQCHGSFPAFSGLGGMDASKSPQVSADVNDR